MEKQETIVANGGGNRPVGGNDKDRVVREPNPIPWLPTLLPISFVLPSATSMPLFVSSTPTRTLLEITLQNEAHDLQADCRS